MISDRAAPDAADQFYKSADLVAPTFTQSVFNNFKEGYFTGFEALNTLQPKADENLQNIWDTIQEGNRKSSELLTFGQKATRFVPNLIANGIGMALDPITYPFAAVGGVAGKGISTLASKVAPEAVSLFARKSIPQLAESTAGKYLPKSLAELGNITTHGFTTFAGLAVPGAVISNYNRDTRSLNWGGFTEEVGFNGGIGALLSIPGYAAGTMFKNILTPDEKIPMPNTPEAQGMPERLETAFKEGKLSKEEYEWGKDLYTDPHKPDLNQRAAKILASKDHPVDLAKSKVNFEMLSEEDWKNLSTIFPEQLNAADYTQDKSALSDFILGNRLDKLRENPEMIDGLRGYLAEMDHKLANKDAKLREADEILDRHLHEGVEAKMPFDQQDLYEQVKANPNEHLPYTIPTIVEKVLSHEQELTELKAENKRLARRFKKTQDQKLSDRITKNESRLNELENTKPLLHSAKDELVHIKNKLLTEKGLVKNYNNTKEYQRLVDLADVWHNAQTLLDRVNLEASYAQQEAYRNLAKGYIDAVRSHVDKFADQDRVKNYLKQRIDHAAGISDEMRAAHEKAKPPLFSGTNEEQFEQFDQQVENSDFKSLNDEYYETKKRYEQFKDAPEALKEMMDCFGRQG